MLKFLLISVVGLHIVQARTIKDFLLDRNGQEDMLVIDTDAGADDAMAISMVLNGTNESNLRIAGITCVRGNAGVHNVTKNVLRTLRVNRRLEIPVLAGTDFGLIATPAVDYYFGGDGFGDFDYPVPDVPLSPEHPAVFLSNLVRQNPGKVSVLALGPLTNLAIAGFLYSDFYQDVRQILFLGGSTAGHGSIQGVEFNVWADPTAARAVFGRSPLDNPITIIPTETLQSLNFSWDWRTHTLGAKGTDVINFLNLAERKVSKSQLGWRSDDPTAAAVLLHPEIVLESFFGIPKLTPYGEMTVDEIHESKAQGNEDPVSKDVGYVRVQHLCRSALLGTVRVGFSSTFPPAVAFAIAGRIIGGYIGGSNVQWTPWDNCSYPAILDYPNPHFPEGEWTVFFAASSLLVSCIFLGRICDHYFLPAVKNIAYGWGLQGDVMNAVVFASAASWPELAISVITLFDTGQAGVGIGTIVGTSVFNTLAVPAICSFIISKGSWVDPVTTSRDTAMAAISLLFLGLVLKNDHVSWMNAGIMLFLYVVYIFGLSSFSYLKETRPEHDVFERCQLLRDACKFNVPQYLAVENDAPEVAAIPVQISGEGFTRQHDLKIFEPRTGYAFYKEGKSPNGCKCWLTLKSVLKVIGRVLIWPFHALLRILIPPANDHPYLVVIVSMIYITVITYVVAWMITVLGYKLNIPNSLLSLTVLSVGLGFPDLLSSLKTAREGTASEALSNALGANTFNILVCLGLPWFIKAIADPYDQNGILLNLDGVLYSVNIMFSALLMFYAALIANRFVFNAVVGVMCIAIYIFFLVTMSLIEFNVFFFVNKPLCNIKDFYNDPS